MIVIRLDPKENLFLYKSIDCFDNYQDKQHHYQLFSAIIELIFNISWLPFILKRIIKQEF
jgi:hypothetical protein